MPGSRTGAGFDLLLARDGVEAEVACDVVSAEEGRDVHRGAWFRLMDRIDPELHTWLAAHPGRYLLKMTLPQGLRSATPGPHGLQGPGLAAPAHHRPCCPSSVAPTTTRRRCCAWTRCCSPAPRRTRPG